MIFTTQEEVDACLKRWQGIMRLQDWNITASLGTLSDLGQGYFGEARVKSKVKVARIKLLEEKYHDEVADGVLDHEETLVHELVHVHLDAVEQMIPATEDAELRRLRHLLLEQTVEAMSTTFIKLASPETLNNSKSADAMEV